MKHILSVYFLIALSISTGAQQLFKVAHVDNKAVGEYSGVYSRPSAEGSSTRKQLYQYFSIKNDTLFTQSPGTCKDALLNVGKDLFILKDGKPYYQFHRNKKGNIISLELYNEPNQYAPHEVAFKTNLALPKEKCPVVLNAKKLELLKGKYDFGGGFFVPVCVEGNKIYVEVPGEEKEEIFAENDTRFFEKKVDGTIEFIKDSGKVTGMIINRGEKYEGRKIE